MVTQPFDDQESLGDKTNIRHCCEGDEGQEAERHPSE